MPSSTLKAWDFKNVALMNFKSAEVSQNISEKNLV